MSKSRSLMNARLHTMIEEGKEVCDVYKFAAENELIPTLKSPSWLVSGLESLNWFTIDDNTCAPHVCFIELIEKTPTSWEATQLAAHTISIRQGRLRGQAQYATVVAQNRRIGALKYEDHWKALVKDVASKLSYLTAEGLYIDNLEDADSCLEAIEGAEDLTEIFQPAQPILFVAGIDRAYDRTTGFRSTWTYTIQSGTAEGQAEIDTRLQVTQSDLEQRAKVKRMVDALIRLFDGKGKLVFVVGPGFEHFDVAECQRMGHVPVFQL
ncbi:hypothetical protein F4824DRAFT_477998 [Ustulina deusta]|nr:hypothetical protein F4824DRAFT_477998 [Ustulina deusta]